MPKDSDLIDWTLADAPDDDPPPGPAPARGSAPRGGPRPARSRVVWVTGLVLLIALLLAGLPLAWENYQRQSAIARVVALEKEAALARNPAQLEPYLDPSQTGWFSSQTRLAVSGLAAPLPLSFLRPLTATADTMVVEALSPNTVRAEVTRQYLAPDGARYAFTLPQFYRFDNQGWQHTPPPDTYWGDSLVFTGDYLELRYLKVDTAFARDLAPALDAALAQICAQWVCAPDYRFTLYLNNTIPPTPPGPELLAHPLPADLPLLFQWQITNPMRFWGNDIHVPSPHAVGYPADAASAQFLQHALIGQVIAQVAQTRLEQPDNAFFYALIERQIAVLGFDSAPRVTGPWPAIALDRLWNMTWYDPGADKSNLLRGAAIVLERLLADQPAGTEAQLFNTLRNAPGPDEWLSNGFGLSTTALREKLLAAAGGVEQFSIHPTRQSDLALSCATGPALFAFGDVQLTPLVSGIFSDTRLISWSPTGRWLNVYLGGQAVLIDLETQMLQWPPRPPTASDPTATTWVSDSIIAYILWPRPSGARSRLDPNLVTLNFYDLSGQPAPFAPIPGIHTYILSPDKTQAAVVTADFGALEARIGFIPALGGELHTRFNGSGVSWSPDGRQLAFTRNFDPRVSLYITAPASGNYSKLWDGALDPPSAPSEGYPLWSPTGETIALVLTQWDAQPRSWIGLIALDDADDVRAQTILEHEGLLGTPQFSADGRYLAVTVPLNPSALPGPGVLARTLVLATDTGQRVMALPVSTRASFAWSPTGHTLVFTTEDGLYQLTEPNGVMQKLADGECGEVLWKSSQQ